MIELQNSKPEKSGLLTPGEVSEQEERYPEGLSSAELVRLFKGRGIKFSEATLRKYVQQGLLPKSQRIGQKGKHKGSRGVYPVCTIRQVNEIKKLMAMDYTTEEIQKRFAFVDGEIEELKAILARIIAKLEESSEASAHGGLVTTAVARQLDEATDSAKTLVEKLESIVIKIRESAQIARNAV